MHHDESSVSLPLPEQTSTSVVSDSPSRKGFLGGIGALGFAAAMGAIMDPQSIHAAEPQASTSPARFGLTDVLYQPDC